MRLFHVSEEPDIEIFLPRKPHRKDLKQEPPLVWALCERTLPNFFTPRNCPRVTFHATETTTLAEENRFFATASRHALWIEPGWVETMASTVLTVYELPTASFVLQDATAGYYTSEESVRPLAVYKIEDLFKALKTFDIEVGITEDLHPLADAVKTSNLNFSLCRMGHANRKRSR